MSKSKTVSVRITTMDAELEFSIKPSTTGKQLFDQVVRTIGLREIWYFGLQFVDSKGFTSWLVLTKKVLQQVGKKHDNPIQFKFRAKFYPEDVNEIIQESTLRMFYLQVKNAILSDEVYCPPDAAVLLASYAVQAKYGDFNQDYHKPGFLANDRLLPQRVLDQHKLTRDAWEEKIATWHKEHKGRIREEAMLDYLKLAQDLEMYGVNYFDIKNKKGTDLTLGIDALGINVFERGDRLTPKIGFPWSEIRNITFHNRKFIIKPIDKKSPDFVFNSSHVRINKTILALCMGNHDLFIRRRKADTIEVQQMKIQAREEKMSKKMALERLAREVSLREEAEKRQKDFEERLQSMNKEMEMRQKELLGAQETIRRLEIQLRELQEAKDELESKQRELQTMMARLEETKEMEAGERARLEEEIKYKQNEISRIQEEVSVKDEETRRLQTEVEEARRKEEEATLALLAASTAQRVSKASSSSSSSSDSEEEMHRPKTPVVEKVEAALAQSAYNGNDFFEAEVQRRSSSSSSESHTMEPVNVEPELLEIQEPKEDEAAIRRMKLLEDVKQSLAAERKPDQLTILDKIYNANISKGNTKYKTLRQVRQGNTKRRVDQFENL
ncbi:moesin/ezrin/radixin homolog 1-like [Penaeus chinensis]|uniref:moesin/ezrin/radixin homolog 1-like n=1 Tax=Penaeus chinensis TaxID=139456 RepID=UPI001FB599B9|nr:moesin/ezrin/radixin homolog 1-like [Penaeus chinensis]XP_047477927.1 moesin/ezrin/radixin homolog 1-like [Penaeus chinensis]